MLKKFGIMLMAISFLLNFSSLVYLPANIFEYFLVQVYGCVILFGISIACLFANTKLRKSILSISLVTAIFALISVTVGILTTSKVAKLADSSSTGNLSIQFQATTTLQNIQLLLINFFVTLIIALILLLIFNGVLKLKTNFD